MGELEPNQMVAVRVGDPESARPQVASGLGQRASRSQRRTGDFKQNLRGERQRAANGDQGATCGDVQRGGELEQILAFFIAASNKHGYRDGKTRPFAAVSFTICKTLQNHPSVREITLLPHLGGQTERPKVYILGKKPGRLPTIRGKSGFCRDPGLISSPCIRP